MRTVVAAALVAGVLAQPAQAATVNRLLYTSDWAGPRAVYAVDPSGATREVVTSRDQRCRFGPGCGIASVLPSPNGRRLLFVDHVDDRSLLFVARSDGANRRLIASGLGIDSLDWAHDSSRFVYAVRPAVPGRLSPSSTRLYTVELGSGRRRLLEVGPAAAAYAAKWSPARSFSLAYTRDAPTGARLQELVVVRSGKARVVATVEWPLVYRWSPDGRALAYAGHGVHVVRSDGSGDRLLADGGSNGLGWSRDGRFVASAGAGTIAVIDVSSRSVRELDLGSRGAFAWSPKRPLLAFESKTGLVVFDAANGTRRTLSDEDLLSLVWSNTGAGVTYLSLRSSLLWTTSNVRHVSLTGTARTLVRAVGTAGGAIADLTWTSMPRGLTLRRPRPRVLADVSTDRIRARWDVTKLDADGGRVAFVACNHVFVWTPASGVLVQAEPSESLSPHCSVAGTYTTSEAMFDLGLAGDRLAFGQTYGCTGGAWSLSALQLSDPGAAAELGRGYGSRCGVSFDVAIGEAVGSGPLLVYSTWRGSFVWTPQFERIVTSQQILRVGGGVVASRAGQLTPLDVAGGRIAVSRGDTFAVLDEHGVELWSTPTGPKAAVFAGAELALIREGELRRYRAATGEFLGSWPLPLVPTGRPCKTAFTFWCELGTLTVQDGAQGLVAYVLAGRVHVVRLADGSDHDVAPGGMARFIDAGLVVANGAELRLIPFGGLG